MPQPSVDSTACDPCRCPCCIYDEQARARHRAGKRAHEPGVEPYTARQLLQCTEFRSSLGPSKHSDEEAQEWWDTYMPEILPWLDEEVVAGLEDPVQAKFAATTLLGAPEMRAAGHDPRYEYKEPYSWEKLGGHEVLFEYLLEGGIPDYWQYDFLGPAIRKFAAYLTRRGLINPARGAEIDASFALWLPRMQQVVDDGGWWSPAGKRQPA